MSKEGPTRSVQVAVAGLLVGVVAALLAASGAAAQVAPTFWQRAARPATATIGPAFPGAVINLATGHSYPGYDNDVFADCVAATVGDLIITSFNTTPATLEITDAFFFAGGTSTQGLTWPQLVDYWSSSSIAGTTLQTWSPLGGANLKATVERWLEHAGTLGRFRGQHSVIDMVNLPDHAVLAGQTVQPGNHMWLIVGYTRRDALVVSWGSEFEAGWSDLLAWSAGRNGWGGFDVVAVGRAR